MTSVRLALHLVSSATKHSAHCLLLDVMDGLFAMASTNLKIFLSIFILRKIYENIDYVIDKFVRDCSPTLAIKIEAERLTLDIPDLDSIAPNQKQKWRAY